MAEIIIALLIAAASFGGGAWVGASQQKKKCNKELTEIVKESNLRTIEMSAKIDSLQNLPAKVDTLIFHTETIIEKTDTLILIAKETLLNTDSIKFELRDFRHEFEKDR